MFAQQVTEGLIREFLEILHLLACEQIHRLPGFIVELYAFTRHRFIRRGSVGITKFARFTRQEQASIGCRRYAQPPDPGLFADGVFETISR